MIRMRILDNARDSLEHTIQHIIPKSKCEISNAKRAILDLSHVIELIFKEHLQRIHPAFIWKDIDKYPNKEAPTVDTHQALKRLEQIGDVCLDSNDKKFIERIKKKRNEIEHFEFELNLNEASIIIGRILSFVLNYSRRYLDLNWDEEVLSNHGWKGLCEYTEFYQSHLKVIYRRIEDEFIDILECTSCYHDTFDIHDKKCILCGHREDVYECTQCNAPYIESALWSDYKFAEICPGCAKKDEAAYGHHYY